MTMQMTATARSNEWRGATIADVRSFLERAQSTGAPEDARVKAEVNNRVTPHRLTLEITWSLPAAEEPEEAADVE